MMLSRASSLKQSGTLDRAASGGSLALPRASLEASMHHSQPRTKSCLGSRPVWSSMPSLPARGSRRPLRQLQAAFPEHVAAVAATKDTKDVFVQAGKRLQSLLSGVGDGEAELIDNYLSEETPEARLQTQVVLGGAVTLVSVAVCMLVGQDPWGGVSLSGESLLAAGVGLGAALPLALFRAWSWTPGAAKVLPQLQDMHITQMSIQSSWYCGCQPWHVALMCALEQLPLVLLLLPAAQGGLIAAVHLYSTALHGLGGAGGSGGFTSPELVAMTCLLVTSMVASVGKGLELGVSDQEYEVVQTAVDNADRYYKLMANKEVAPHSLAAMLTSSAEDSSGGGCSSSSGSAPMVAASGGTAAAEAALAFRSVAQAWMGARNEASLAAMGMCFVDVMVLGALWYATGSLLAPAAATLAINGVDYYHMHQTVLRREQHAAQLGSGGSSKKKNSKKNNNNNNGATGA